MSISYHNCEVCGQSVDLESKEQSQAANWLQVHQHTCLHIFLAAIPFSTKVELNEKQKEYDDRMESALAELLDHAEMEYMFKHELTPSYYHWCLEMFFNLIKHKEILDSLHDKWKDGHNKARKEDEEKTTQIT